TVELRPAKTVDMGSGKGTPVTREVRGGVVGLLLDGRGRPLQLPSDNQARLKALTKWYQAVDLYPKQGVKREA
ncbi:MAG: methylaspartate mutase, partial [Nitrospiraceae bacterium]